MRLPHHPEIVRSLRRPTPTNPWCVLISGCLSGQPVGVDGTDYGLGEAKPAWLAPPLVRFVSFCPEDFKLGTPRTMPDLHRGDGFAVLDGTAQVLDENRKDITDPMIAGANRMVELAQEHGIDFVLLTDRSGACGSQVISIGCRLEEPVEYRKGVGVAAAALLRAGFHIVSQRDYRTLELIHSRMDEHYSPDLEKLDHHEHPWVIANLD